MTQFGVSPRTSGPLWKKLENPTTPSAGLPTALQIAVAIVHAARQHKEDPFRYVSGAYHSCNGRFIAYWALDDLYPGRSETIARWVGAKQPSTFVRKAARNRGVVYFSSEEHIDAVKAAVRAREAA